MSDNTTRRHRVLLLSAERGDLRLRCYFSSVRSAVCQRRFSFCQFLTSSSLCCFYTALYLSKLAWQSAFFCKPANLCRIHPPPSSGSVSGSGARAPHQGACWEAQSPAKWEVSRRRRSGSVPRFSSRGTSCCCHYCYFSIGELVLKRMCLLRRRHVWRCVYSPRLSPGWLGSWALWRAHPCHSFLLDFKFRALSSYLELFRVSFQQIYFPCCRLKTPFSAC